MLDYPIHPDAARFPDMEPADYEDFKADIARHGQRQAVLLYRGKILDGRHRARACKELGMPLKVEEWQGDEHGTLAFVISVNDKRRHLKQSQRALIAVEAVNVERNDTLKQNAARRGSDGQICPSEPRMTQPQAAKLLGVSTRAVKEAKVVIDKGAPELVEMLRHGKVSAHAAAAVAKLPIEEQAVAVAGGSPAVKAAARELREARARPAAKKPPDKRAGKHVPKTEELNELTQQVEGLVEHWGSLGQVAKVVNKWEAKDRWTFCEKLEALARKLRHISACLKDNA